MSKINYVECLSCKWKVSQSNYDPHVEYCESCNNSREVPDPRDILCNMCGYCMCPLGTMNEQVPHGLYDAYVGGGYDSYHLFDMTSYKFSFCEKCLRELFTKCKIPPVVNCNMNHCEEDYLEDLENYEHRIWKDSDGPHQAYLNGKCNIYKDCPNNAVYTILINDEFSEDCACHDHINDYTSRSLSYKAVDFIPDVLKSFL